jgi:hypothetical protein
MIEQAATTRVLLQEILVIRTFEICTPTFGLWTRTDNCPLWDSPYFQRSALAAGHFRAALNTEGKAHAYAHDWNENFRAACWSCDPGCSRHRFDELGAEGEREGLQPERGQPCGPPQHIQRSGNREVVRIRPSEWCLACVARLMSSWKAASPGPRRLERDEFSSNRHPALRYRWSVIFFRKPVPTFRDHAVLVEHDLFRKPVPTFRDHALLVEHDLFRKPVPTFRDHALTAHQSGLMFAVRGCDGERALLPGPHVFGGGPGRHRPADWAPRGSSARPVSRASVRPIATVASRWTKWPACSLRGSIA